MHSTIAENSAVCVGLEIQDIDFATSLDSVATKKITQLFHENHLLIIRNQRLTEEQLIQASLLFGKPAPALVPTYRLEKYPIITRHTNKKDENRLPAGVVAPEHVFHSDSYFTCNPSKATLFYCLKAPNQGGETHFVNMCSAYDSLDESKKKLIADKKVSYKNAYINQPPVIHPLIRLHPVTKQKALFVNLHRALGIVGLDESNSLKIIKDLYAHATSPKFIYKHKWRNGDLLIWNNPTTMHCATPIPDSEERLLYRILTEGDLPVA